jgi:hypothetical protein
MPSQLEELRSNAQYFIDRLASAQQSVRQFERLCGECSRCPLRTSNDELIHDIFRRLFRVFLSVADDLWLLNTGRVCREYHRAQLTSAYSRRGWNAGDAFHSRGRESAYYKTEGKLAKCSVDGLNFEFRHFNQRRKFEDVRIYNPQTIATSNVTSFMLSIFLCSNWTLYHL